MLYTYFVSFTFKSSEREQRFGSSFFDLAKQIKERKDLYPIIEQVSECYDALDIIILNFQLIDEREN